MRYHIRPVAKRLGINKQIAWHTLRRSYATILKANGEDVKVVQELLRHASKRMTVDVYAQALSADKRKAQSRVVQMIHPKAQGGTQSSCTVVVPRDSDQIAVSS